VTRFDLAATHEWTYRVNDQTGEDTLHDYEEKPL
jgi:hypothetical protein